MSETTIVTEPKHKKLSPTLVARVKVVGAVVAATAITVVAGTALAKKRAKKSAEFEIIEPDAEV